MLILPKITLKFFEFFFTPAIFETFVHNTNAYGRDTKRSGWRDVTVDELKQFLGIIIYMGINELPTRECYWRDEIFRSQFITSIMSLNRFSDILLCWHFVNTAPYNDREIRNRNKEDPFWSVAKFVETLAGTCRNLYRSFRHVDIDEQCIPLKGRHLAKQYDKEKANKWHFKDMLSIVQRRGT